MEIPTDIVSAFGAVFLTAFLSYLRSPSKKFDQLSDKFEKLSKRMDGHERKLLILIVMLNDRGFKIPSESDTERFLKAKNFDVI